MKPCFIIQTLKNLYHYLIIIDRDLTMQNAVALDDAVTRTAAEMTSQAVL